MELFGNQFWNKLSSNFAKVFEVWLRSVRIVALLVPPKAGVIGGGGMNKALDGKLEGGTVIQAGVGPRPTIGRRVSHRPPRVNLRAKRTEVDEVLGSGSVSGSLTESHSGR